jgi:hypothetical protein
LPDFSWHKIPKRRKIYQTTTKYTKWPWNISNSSKIDQMVIKNTKIFHCQTLQNSPKLGFLVWKQTIWQPCRAAVKWGATVRRPIEKSLTMFTWPRCLPTYFVESRVWFWKAAVAGAKKRVDDYVIVL